MKNKFLEIAGVATEEEFYNMFPSEEAFFEAYPEARQMKKGGNVPTNPQLYSRVKSEAKQKFDRWPSAYGSAWLVKEYKRRGGGYRKGQFGGSLNPENPFASAAGNIMQKQQQDNSGGNMMQAAMQFAPMLMGVPPMANGGKMPQWLAEKRFKAAGNEDMMDSYGYMYGGDTNMMYGGDYMQVGGEPDGEMAMGQLMSISDKAGKLRQFIGEDTDLEPWVSSKLTKADDYIDSVSDYMMYSEDQGRDIEVEEEQDYNMGEMEEMKKGGIPSRYKNMGFTKVGQKKKSNRKGKKWMVLAKKGDKYKVVHGGYAGMKDFSQHGSEKRKDRFWDRMGGKNSAKANDPFSPLYWHKKFGTWQEGGEIPVIEDMVDSYNPYDMMKKGGIYIDPSKRGTFKAQATKMGMSVQEAADAILNAPEGKYSPAMRRKANFARNFAKQMGGEMDSDYNLGIEHFTPIGRSSEDMNMGIEHFTPIRRMENDSNMGIEHFTPVIRRGEDMNIGMEHFMKRQQGGQIMMGDTMELDDAEIQRLMDMGYGVEYID